VSALLVAAGAALGAPLRWWVDRLVQQRWTPAFPWGTFIVNVVGSLLLGLLARGVDADAPILVFLGIGFCGALTTFSSFAWETLRLLEDGARLFSLVNVVASTVVCIGCAWLGWQLGSLV
jgi:fluoride exporter